MRLLLLASLVLLTVLPGCRAVEAVAIGLVYDRAELPAANVVRDLPYVEGPDAHPEKHRLNLFLPLPALDADSGAETVRQRDGEEAGWPTVVFVHGGSWTEGDRDLTFGGEDVYNNIGRALARQGIGAVTVSYRLLPEVTWPEQIEDVARAVAWVREHVGLYGGDPDALFLMGHSAGAQLAARVALDPDVRSAHNLTGHAICGVIPVSGAALDLTDRRSFELSDNFDFYARRFGPRGEPVPTEPPAEPFMWQTEASPIQFLLPEMGGPAASEPVPPFLILYAGGESRALQRQSQLLHEALLQAGAQSEVVVVPGLSHTRIVPALSQDTGKAGSAIVDFIRGQRCR